MPDYTFGKIYKVECESSGLVYIGLTASPLATRFSSHKSYHKYKGEYSNASIALVLNSGDCVLSLVEDYPCSYFEELKARENEYFEYYDMLSLGKCVNFECRKFGSKQRERREKYKEHLMKGYPPLPNVLPPHITHNIL